MSALRPTALILLAYLSLLALGLMDNVRSPYFPLIIDEFQLSDSLSSWFFALASLCAFFSAILGRHLIEKFQSLHLLRIGLVLMALGFFLMSQMKEFFSLLIFCGLFGAGFGLVTVAQNVSIQEVPDISLRRRLFSGLHSMYGFAALLSPILAGFFFSWQWSWRTAFMWISLVPAGIALFSFITFGKKQNLKLSKEDLLQGLRSNRETLSPKDLSHGLYLGLTISIYMIAEISLSTRIPLYAIRELGWSLESGTYLLATFFLGLLAGRLLFLIFRFSNWSDGKILNLSLVLSTISFFIGLYGSPYFLSLTGFFLGPFYPLAMQFVSGIFLKKSAAVIAYTVGIGSLVVVAMHSALGLLTEAFGIFKALHMGPLSLILVLFLLWLRPRLFANQ